MPIRCCSSQSTSAWRVCASMKMAIRRRSMGLRSRCDRVGAIQSCPPGNPQNIMEVGPCDYFWFPWNIEELWWRSGPPLPPRPLFAPLWAALVDWSLVWWRSTLDANIHQQGSFLDRAKLCLALVVWCEHHWTGTSPLTLSRLPASWRLPASTELQSTLSRVPWQHQRTAPSAGMCCQISFLDKIIVVDSLNITKPWNGRSMTRKVFAKVHPLCFLRCGWHTVTHGDKTRSCTGLQELHHPCLRVVFRHLCVLPALRSASCCTWNLSTVYNKLVLRLTLQNQFKQKVHKSAHVETMCPVLFLLLISARASESNRLRIGQSRHGAWLNTS